MEAKKKCVIAICTYQRPVQLRKAIVAVSQLKLPLDLTVELLVVDNSPSHLSKQAFDKAADDLKIRSVYLEESNRGIVYARNSALEYAKNQAIDYLAFFDDDDYPDSNWIHSLWSCINTYTATVVVGRMNYKWPKSVYLDDEVKRLYDNALGKMDSGTVLRKCGSGNTLIELGFIKKQGLRFHHRFNLTGGEDSHFFESLTKLGGKIIWCNEAVVHSEIDENRASEPFVFGRRYNVGYTRYLSDKLIYGALSAFWKSSYYCIDVWARCFFDLFRSGSKVRARTKRRLAESNGRIDAMLGKKFESYKESDGH